MHCYQSHNGNYQLWIPPDDCRQHREKVGEGCLLCQGVPNSIRQSAPETAYASNAFQKLRGSLFPPKLILAPAPQSLYSKRTNVKQAITRC